MKHFLDGCVAGVILAIITLAFLAAAAWTTVLPSIGLLWLAGLL